MQLLTIYGRRINMLPKTNCYNANINPVNILENENMWLNNQLCKANNTIYFLQNKVNSLMKTDILRNEALYSDGKVIMYSVYRNDNPYGSTTTYAQWNIQEVIIIVYDPKYNKDNDISLNINGVNVVIDKKSFDKNKILKILNLYGFSVIMKDKADRLGLLFMNYIAALLKDAKVIFIPYCSGWHLSGNKWVYLLNYVKFNNLNAPIFNNRLITTGTKEPIKSCEMILKTFSVLKKPVHRILILGILLYSLIFSLLKDKNAEFKHLIILSGDNNILKIIVDFFFNIFNHKGYVSLNQKNADIKNEIISTKDCPLIFETRGCDFRKHNPNTNFELIRDIVCYGAYIEKDNKQFNVNAPVFLINNELGYLIEPELFFEIEVNKEDINMALINDISKNKERLGDVISEFLKYVPEVDLNYAINSLDITGVNDRYKNDYRAVGTALTIFSNFIYNKYGLELKSLINDKFEWNSYLKQFFNRDIDDCKSITALFIDTLSEVIDEGILKVKSDTYLDENDNIDDYIFAVNNEILIRHNSFLNIIVPKMGIGIKARKLLKYLEMENFLVLNRNGYECKRIIKFSDGTKRQVAFVVVKSDCCPCVDKAKSEVIFNECNASKQNPWDF